jgi:RteC protein
MNEAAINYFNQMQEEINALTLHVSNEILLVESCFKIALHYRNLIKGYVDGHVFEQPAAEINFFKHIKPLFGATVEYNILCYQTILFKPVHDKGELTQYWVQQLKRIDRFYSRNAEFYNYYTSNQTSRDELYFTRPKYQFNSEPNGNHHKSSVSSYVHIAASILSYGQYREYVTEQLHKLSCEERSQGVAAVPPTELAQNVSILPKENHLPTAVCPLRFVSGNLFKNFPTIQKPQLNSSS